MEQDTRQEEPATGPERHGRAKELQPPIDESQCVAHLKLRGLWQVTLDFDETVGIRFAGHAPEPRTSQTCSANHLC